MIKVTAIADTWIKKSASQSKDLSQNEKKAYVAGDVISIEEIIKTEGSHAFCKLAWGQGYWWLFREHFKFPSRDKSSSLATQIVNYMRAKRYKVFEGKYNYNIVYIEGMNVDGSLNSDRPNEFNDLRLVIEIINGVPDIVGMWEATTEPGRQYTQSPLNAKGAARIAFNQYDAWQVGIHKDHEALVQTGGAVSVHRDFDKNFIRTGDKIYTGYFGINQHWGYDMSSDNIGGASAGCLVGRTRKGHREFMRLIKQDSRYKKNKNYIFTTTVIPGDDLMRSSHETTNNFIYFERTNKRMICLSLIAWCEGTDTVLDNNPTGYNIQFSGRTFNDLSKHPMQVISAGGYNSSAAGRYQIMDFTEKDLLRQYPKFSNFEPNQQDERCIALIKRRGALQDVDDLNLLLFLRKCSREWASLPYSPYGQPTKSIDQVKDAFAKLKNAYQL